MRKSETNFLFITTIFVISIVIANVVGARVITTGIDIGGISIAMSGGAITYAFTFLCTDVVGEIWGKRKAKSMIKYGFVGQIFAVIMIILTGLCPAVDANMDKAYHVLLDQTWFFVAGSLCAYFVSQNWDVFIFHKIREHFIKKHGDNRARWIWNNASTMTSQIIDTAIYAFISFGLGMGWLWTHEGRQALLGVMIGQYLLKFFLAILDTPIFILLTKNKKNL